MFINACQDLLSSGNVLTPVLIGQENDIQRLKKIVRDEFEGLFVWLPPFDEFNFNQFLASVDLLVSCPITDGSSVTVLEAMLRRVFVISTLTEGSSQWILNGYTGYTIPVNSELSLKNAIQSFLLLPPYLKKEILDNAKRLVDHSAGWADSSIKIINSIQSISNSSYANS